LPITRPGKSPSYCRGPGNPLISAALPPKLGALAERLSGGSAALIQTSRARLAGFFCRRGVLKALPLGPGTALAQAAGRRERDQCRGD
jgi:hypothetical protein